MINKRFVFSLIGGLIFLTQVAGAAQVDTVFTYSASMKMNIPAVVITPEGYTKAKAYPVVYLLHGFGGSYRDWIHLDPAITESADRYQMILVCAEGGRSWYMDSPVDTSIRYETYTSKELVNWIDNHYSTIKGRKGRAITGLSMGGHGALYQAFRHQDVFGAAGSMSGGVDIRPFPDKWDLKLRLGDYSEKPENWEKNTIVNQVHLLTPGGLRLIIDCGSEDFFHVVNETLHKKLTERNIPHDYIVRPGVHNWTYWRNAVDYQLLFFYKFFISGQ